jgi:predicted esterase
MKKVVLKLIIFSVVYGSINAQNRYFNEITDSVLTKTFTYATKNSQKLDMDIYFPIFDNEKNRAVIIYVHGGGFSNGQRDGTGIPEFCTRLSKYGYVTVSISYRLTRKDTQTGFTCDCPAEQKLEAVKLAVEDLHNATTYLIKNSDKFGIDPGKILISGSSAGAEVVLLAAYEKFEEGLNRFSYAGVIGMAGAIPDIEKINEETAIPSLFFHGSCDNKVPYATAPHRYCKQESAGYWILNGSYSIAKKLRSLGKPFWLHTICGGNHEIAVTPMIIYFNQIIEFCYHFVILGEIHQIHSIIKLEQDQTKCQFYNFCKN